MRRNQLVKLRNAKTHVIIIKKRLLRSCSTVEQSLVFLKGFDWLARFIVEICSILIPLNSLRSSKHETISITCIAIPQRRYVTSKLTETKLEVDRPFR